MSRPDLTGPMEARLLELERRQARLGDALRHLDRRSLAVGQGLWDAWSESRTPPPPAPAGGAVPVCWLSDPTYLRETLYLRNPVYSDFTLQWDDSSPDNPRWTACMLVDYPGGHSDNGGPACPAVNGVALWIDYYGEYTGSDPSWLGYPDTGGETHSAHDDFDNSSGANLFFPGTLNLRWYSASPTTTQAPAASTCSDTPNCIFQANRADNPSCGPFVYSEIDWSHNAVIWGTWTSGDSIDLREDPF